MISLDEALKLIEEQCSANIVRSPTESISLRSALHRVLAENIVSDVDSPPYDKALMDGYAVRAADVSTPECTLKVLETVTAGEVPTQALTANTATRIMTGSPLPPGADAVVVVEETEAIDERVLVRSSREVAAEQNLLRQGTCLRNGDVVLQAGQRLNAGQVGLLAEVGADPVPVRKQTSVRILTTGNELVPAGQSLEPGMIRNSNGPMLEALAQRDLAEVQSLGIGRDDADDLRQKIEQGLESDVLILSGGVSAGDLDLVPSTLADCGVREVFHKVQIKPGKPVWFGIGPKTLVFGLPGNPVSSFVCYLLFARTAIRRLQGLSSGISYRPATLAYDFEQPGNRPVFYPARRETEAGEPSESVTLLPWKGSADLRTLADADCLAYLPPSSSLKAGASINVIHV